MGKKTEAAAYTCAMDKLRDEMAGSKEPYVQYVGEYLTGYLLEHPEAEAAFMNKDKTIKGSLKDMEDYARKHKTGNVAVVDPETGFRIVLEYFGIKNAHTQKPSPAPEGAVQGKVAAPSALTDEVVPHSVTDHLQTPAPAPDPFDLDALLGGVL